MQHRNDFAAQRWLRDDVLGDDVKRLGAHAAGGRLWGAARGAGMITLCRNIPRNSRKSNLGPTKLSNDARNIPRMLAEEAI